LTAVSQGRQLWNVFQSKLRNDVAVVGTCMSARLLVLAYYRDSLAHCHDRIINHTCTIAQLKQGNLRRYQGRRGTYVSHLLHTTLPGTEGNQELAHILQRRSDGQVYVHYDGLDKRLDEWIPVASLKPVDPFARKRKRDTPSPTPTEPETQPEPIMTEEEFDIKHHKQITAKRNFDKVNFGQWRIKTWCVPYIIMDPSLISCLL
jgi:hypothetical protein